MTISRDSRTNRWRLRQNINGKQVQLGTFRTEFEATEKRDELLQSEYAQTVEIRDKDGKRVTIKFDVWLPEENAEVIAKMISEKGHKSLSPFLAQIAENKIQKSLKESAEKAEKDKPG